jgi:hypothetical protein
VAGLVVLSLITVFGASLAVGRAPGPRSAFDPAALTPIRADGSPSALPAQPAGSPAAREIDPVVDFLPNERSFAPRPEPNLPQSVGVIVKPTPTPRPRVASAGTASRTGNSVSGTASWYCLPGVSACHYQYSGGMYAAAGPALRVGNWRGRTVRVCSGGRCVNVKLIDWCQCYGTRVIDLYSDAFRQLGSLSSGTLRVTVSW